MNNNTFYIITVIVLIIIYFLKRFFSSGVKKKKPSLSTFGYRLIYTDQKVRRRRKGVIYSKILYSKKYELKGKPDFLYKKLFGKKIIPVELKSGRIGDKKFPHFGDLMQLTAYFIIVDETYKVKPRYGKLIYSDCMFKVKNTKALRNQFLSITEDMRIMLKTGKGECSPDFVKCRHCVCNGTVCEHC